VVQGSGADIVGRAQGRIDYGTGKVVEPARS
jgi:hypothetical protein